MPPMSTLNDRARQRLKEEKTRRHLSERDLAGILKWSQSRIAQKLGGRTPITLDELESLCFALGTQPTEVVRDRGLEFCAEMTPSELRFLETLRTFTPEEKQALMTLLHVQFRSRLETRGATKPKSPLKKIR